MPGLPRTAKIFWKAGDESQAYAFDDQGQIVGGPDRLDRLKTRCDALLGLVISEERALSPAEWEELFARERE
jgi:hypothetical protein